MKASALIVQVKYFIKISWVLLLISLILFISLKITDTICINNEIRKLHVFISRPNFVHMVCSVFHFVQLDSFWLIFNLDFGIEYIIVSYIHMQNPTVFCGYFIDFMVCFQTEFCWLSFYLCFSIFFYLCVVSIWQIICFVCFFFFFFVYVLITVIQNLYFNNCHLASIIKCFIL